MPRGGALTFGDIEGKLEVLRVACTKCDRVGRYQVAKLIERYGPDGSLPEWRHEISKNCPGVPTIGWRGWIFAVRIFRT